MKNNFSNFFEIGKLDKGLFRVWVILSIIWLIVMGVVYLDSYEIRAFSKAKKITSNYDIYCEAIEQTKTRWKKNVKTNLVLLCVTFEFGDTQDAKKNKINNFFIIDL